MNKSSDLITRPPVRIPANKKHLNATPLSIPPKLNSLGKPLPMLIMDLDLLGRANMSAKRILFEIWVKLMLRAVIADYNVVILAPSWASSVVSEVWNKYSCRVNTVFIGARQKKYFLERLMEMHHSLTPDEQCFYLTKSEESIACCPKKSVPVSKPGKPLRSRKLIYPVGVVDMNKLDSRDRAKHLELAGAQVIEAPEIHTFLKVSADELVRIMIGLHTA